MFSRTRIAALAGTLLICAGLAGWTGWTLRHGLDVTIGQVTTP